MTADLGRDTDVLDAQHHREAFAAGRFLRLVNWHATPAGGRALLKAELSWYLERYVPVLPADLDRFFDTGEWALDRPGFIPAFYDSHLDHATTVAPVCDELGLTAWFFPVSGVLDVPADEQRAWADANDIDLVAGEPEAPWAMSWDDLAVVSRRHVVAAHTASHASAASITTAADAHREIALPIERLRDLTGRMPPSFAFLYGTPPVVGTVAGDAVIASGVHYATTNTSYLRLND